jgi:two-component sensor histidine kinase/tetratricopeptide (TPR) repeat protein
MLLSCCAHLGATTLDSLRQVLSKRDGAERLPVLVQLCDSKLSGMTPRDELKSYAEELLRLASNHRDTLAWVKGCLCAAAATDDLSQKKWLAQAQQLATGRPLLMVEVLGKRGDNYNDLGQTDSATAVIEQALLLAQKHRHLSQLANLTGGLAKIYSALGYAAKADSLGKLAFTYCQNQQDSAAAFRRWGGIQKDLGHADEAIRAFMEAYRIEKKSGNNILAAFNLHQSATILRNQGRYEQAIAQFEEVVRLVKPLHDLTGLARAYNSLGSLYFEMGEHDKALRNFRLSLSLKKEIGSPKKTLATINNIAELFLRIGQYDSCLALCKTYLPASQKIEYFQIETNLAFFGAMAAAKTRQPALAHQYLALGEKAIGRVKTTEEKPSVHQFAAQAYAILGDFENAYRHQVLYQTAQAANFDKEKSRIISEVEARFETEKKEQQILALAQENELKNARIGRDRNRLLALLGGLGLAGTLALTLWRNAANRKRHNLSLAATNDELIRKNHEVETLLREIHHRVKNNLQIISSLLRMQARRVSDQNTLEALRTGQARVRSMALLHQRLYQGDHIKEIPMQPYLTDLATSLMDAYQADDNNIRLQLDLAEGISLDVDTAVPLGLIANELLTNSLKYAFPDGRSGRITLSLKKTGQRLRLEIGDDGIGFPLTAGKPSTSRTSFGLELVDSLAQKIKANLEFFNETGAKSVLTMPLEN